MAIVALVLLLVTGCSAAGGGGASSSPVLKDSRVAASPTATAPTESAIDITSLTGLIVFDDFHDIWSINADGTGLERLTRSPWPEFQPALSPDGRSIAYRSEPHERPELWVMHADGTGQHRLARDGGFPTWSPDGTMIAYAAGGGPAGRSSIVVMNADGSGRRRVPHTDYGEYPSWSPDGRWIAFNSNVSGEGLMYVAAVDGSKFVDLSRAGQGHEVAWSPDGRSILFASQRDHSDNLNDIYVMRPDGSGVRRLTRDGGETPAWSPDGRYIVFAALGGLGLIRADGSGATSLPVAGMGEATFPDWR